MQLTSNHYSPLPTHGLTCSSPARDGGNPTPTQVLDQLGRSRVGVADIGAHERVDSLDLAILNLMDRGGNSLREVLQLACPGDSLSLNQLTGIISLESTLEFTQAVFLSGNPTSPIILTGSDSVRPIRILSEAMVEVEWLTVADGYAQGQGGGGILNQGSLVMRQCAIVNNRAEAGGGIANYGNLGDVSLSLFNCTLSGNVAESFTGGAIDHRNYSFKADAQLTHCTLSNNQAEYRGGGIFTDKDSGEFSLSHTIVAGNDCEEGPDAFGVLRSSDYNLFGNSSSIQVTAQAGDLLDAQAELDPLGNYGGPSLTHRLMANSDAIDAGALVSDLLVDQRGLARLINQQVDIGSFEFDPLTRIGEAQEAVFDIQVRPQPLGTNPEIYLPIGRWRLEFMGIDGKSLGQHALHSQGGWQLMPLDPRLQNRLGWVILRITGELGQRTILVKL